MTAEMITAISALIAGFAGIISAIMLNRKTTALMEYRLEQVEKELKERKQDSARFETIEKAILAIQKDIEFIKNK